MNEKPSQLNLTSSRHSSQSRTQLHNSSQPPMMSFPYFPPPHMYFQPNSWPTNSHFALSTSQPPGPHQNPTTWPKSVKGPIISAWLCHCDNHPDRCGENFSALTGNFDEQGYRKARYTLEMQATYLTLSMGSSGSNIPIASNNSPSASSLSASDPEFESSESPRKSSSRPSRSSSKSSTSSAVPAGAFV